MTRLSAMLAIGVGLVLLFGPLLAFFRPVALSTPLFPVVLLIVGLLGALIPLGAGIAALFRQDTPYLPIAWGWVLGNHVPAAMLAFAVPRPSMPHELLQLHTRSVWYMVRPDMILGIGIPAIAVLGLAIWLIGQRPGWRP